MKRVSWQGEEMGFVARKSFKVMPGVRMTVSKGGVSTSVGTRGARVTRTASGRVTRTVGVPGTGIRHTKTVGATSGSPRRPDSAPAGTSVAAQLPKPGFTAPRWEKQLHAAMLKGDFAAMGAIGQSSTDAALPASLLEAMFAYQGKYYDRARHLLAWVWTHGGAVEGHPFVAKYLSGGFVNLNIAEGVTATVPFSRDAVGLALAELHQQAEDLNAAIDVIEHLEPSLIAAVSLAELYLEAGRHGDVIDITNGLTNSDDPTALLMTFRGVAFRETGNLTAARESFKEALKSSKRDAGIRHLAFMERASTYLVDGKKALARKDLERIMADDANYPGLAEELAKIE